MGFFGILLDQTLIYKGVEPGHGVRPKIHLENLKRRNNDQEI